MSKAEGDVERFGRALRLTALAATLVALAAVVGPRLASSGDGRADDAPTATSLPGGITPVTNTARPTLPAAAPTDAAFATTSTTTTTGAPPTTTTTTTTTTPAIPVTDASAVELSLAGTHAGRQGAERSSFFAGETIGWHFRVTNSGEEYLWGVFVYLERYGPVACTSRRLAVGASTDCWAESTAFAPRSHAEAWVTAWTETRMVGDRLLRRVATTVD